MKNLEQLESLVNELSQTNSSNEKKEILGNHPKCKELLYYTYNPFLQFNITSNYLKKRNDLVKDINEMDITELLILLSDRTITGHKAISVVNGFVEKNKNYEDIIYKIIDKNLEVRVDAKLINKVWPGLIPEFEVALAKKYDDYEDKIDFHTQRWLASRKMDGVRVITIIDNNGDIEFFSRKGKELSTLDKVKEELEKYKLTDTVFDGELCLVDEDGNEDFSSVMKEIRKKNHIIENPKYKVFDMLNLTDFINKESESVLSERYEELKNTIKEGNYIDIVEQIKIEDKQHLMEMTTNAISNGWEGLIIRYDAPYEGKRTKDILKVKQFQDDEYIIEDVEFGDIRFIEDGQDIEEEMLSSVVINHKGYKVNVGSGFSIDERRYYYKNPDELIGKEATITYFEETTNKQGTLSLRFPTVKKIYEERRDV